MKNDYESLSPLDKIEYKIAEHNTINVELNAVSSLNITMKFSEMEKKLSKERYELLQYNVSACDKEIYRVFYQEIPRDSPYRTELQEKIEYSGVAVWAYSSQISIKQNDITTEEYKALSYREKIERKIAEYKIINAENVAVIRRAKSNEISETEKKFLKKRELELEKIILSCIQEIWRVVFDEIPASAPDAKELDKLVASAGITQERYDKVYSFLQKGIKNV
jgi:hypothetical protein